MREILEKGRAAYVNGAWSAADEAVRRVVVYTEEPSGWPAAAPPSARPLRERSGVAYAAGFAGVLYLFRYSLAPLALSPWGSARLLGMGLVFFLSLSAPLALALSFVAGWRLDRSPDKYGRPQALFGFFVGWLGVAAWVVAPDERWPKALLPF